MTQRLLIGQTIEHAWFFRHELERAAGEQAIKRAIQDTAMAAGVALAPITWQILEPSDERLPEDRPEHWRGAQCLVGSAVVVSIESSLTPESFVASLERPDLERLRSIVRVIHRRANPLDPPLTDSQADQMVESVGPRIGARMLAEAVNRRAIN